MLAGTEDADAVLVDEVSFSVSVTRPVIQTGRLLWRVERYSLMEDVMSSPILNLLGRKWHFQLTRVSVDPLMASLNLQLHPSNPQEEISFEGFLRLSFDNGKRVLGLPSSGLQRMSSGVLGEFEIPLNDPQDLRSFDVFDVAIDISIYKEPESVSCDHRLPNPLPIATMMEVEGSSSTDPFLQQLFDFKQGQDVVIFSSDFELFPVHACVLAAQSEVFKTMLLSPMTRAGKRKEIRLDFNKDVVTRFLDFIYKGSCEVRGFEEFLLQLGHLYELPGLVCLSETSMLENFDVQTAMKILPIAKLYERDILFTACLRHIAFNWPTLSEDSGTIAFFQENLPLLDDVLSAVNDLKQGRSPGILKRKR